MSTEKLLTIEEFEQFADTPENAERLLELVDGRIAEKIPFKGQGEIIARIAFYLTYFNEQYGDSDAAGKLTIVARYRVPDDPLNVRILDIAYRADSMLPKVIEGTVLNMPDLAIEVKAPESNDAEMHAKAMFFLANGTRCVWIVHPKQRKVKVYWLDYDDTGELSADDMLEGRDVLPGFALKVRSIFPR